MSQLPGLGKNEAVTIAFPTTTILSLKLYLLCWVVMFASDSWQFIKGKRPKIQLGLWEELIQDEQGAKTTRDNALSASF